MSLITTIEAAKQLNVTPLRIRQLIQAKRLRAARIGRDWLVQSDDLEGYQRGTPGRKPAKPERPAKVKGLDLDIREDD